MYSYETIIDLSFKMKKSTLPDEAIAKLNNIRKTLNIPVVEIIKKTVIQKKQSEIAQITKILNKMTENNYEKLKVELFELVKSIENIEDIHKITNTIFNIVSINVFYSKFFSKLYTELIPLNKEFFFVFQGHYDTYLNELNDIEYVSSKTDYDKFCDYNKEIDKMDSMLSFFINLMKNNICSVDNIANLCISLQKKLNAGIEISGQQEHNDKLLNAIYIIIKESIDYLIFNGQMEIINNNIEYITNHPKITPKIKFKCMDIKDILKQF